MKKKERYILIREKSIRDEISALAKCRGKGDGNKELRKEERNKSY